MSSSRARHTRGSVGQKSKLTWVWILFALGTQHASGRISPASGPPRLNLSFRQSLTHAPRCERISQFPPFRYCTADGCGRIRGRWISGRTQPLNVCYEFEFEFVSESRPKADGGRSLCNYYFIFVQSCPSYRRCAYRALAWFWLSSEKRERLRGSTRRQGLR